MAVIYPKSFKLSEQEQKVELYAEYSTLRETKSERLRRFAVAFGIVIAASAFAWPFLPRRYEASSVIILHASEQDDSVSGLRQVLFDEGAIQSEMDRLSSSSLLQQVAKRLDLANDTDFARGLFWPVGLPFEASVHLDEMQVRKRLKDRLNVTREHHSYTLRVTFSDVDPERAKNLANILIAVYFDDQLERKRQQYEARHQQFVSAVNTLKTRTETASQALRSFIAATSLNDYGEETDLQGQWSVLNSELIQARTHILESRNKNATIATKQSVQPAMMRDASSLGGEGEAYWLKRESLLQTEMSAILNKINALKLNDLHLNELRRAFDSEQTALTAAEARLNAHNENTHALHPDADVVASADPPLSPSFPNPVLTIIGSFMLACLAGVVAAFRPWRDPSFAGQKEAERIKDLP